jgi:hypothetical protein
MATVDWTRDDSAIDWAQGGAGPRPECEGLVVLVEIRETFEDERGYGPAYGLNGPADNSPPCHVRFLFSIFFSFQPSIS